MNKKWTVIVEQDPNSDDLILPIPQEVLEAKGWIEGDNLIWIDLGGGAWELRRDGD
jgi:hypothetical protein